MGLFDFLKRKRNVSLSDLHSGMPEAEFLSALPGLSAHIFDVVQKTSIQFYRDIHSHDADPFPKVKDEFFYLVYFVAKSRIISLFPDGSGMKMADALREDLDRNMKKIDRRFSGYRFWEAYNSRESSYEAIYDKHARDKDNLITEDLLSAFSGFLLELLDSPPAKVRYHGMQMAGEAIFMLEGRN